MMFYCALVRLPMVLLGCLLHCVHLSAGLCLYRSCVSAASAAVQEKEWAAGKKRRRVFVSGMRSRCDGLEEYVKLNIDVFV